MTKIRLLLGSTGLERFDACMAFSGFAPILTDLEPRSRQEAQQREDPPHDANPVGLGLDVKRSRQSVGPRAFGDLRCTHRLYDPF